MEIIVWLKHSAVAQWVLYSAWGSPILLCMHAIGMALVVGCGLMTCLRILGFAKAIPISFFEKLFRFAWTGVALNVGSGIVLFIVNGDKYLGNWTFQLKILFIVAATITTWLMWRTVHAHTTPDGVLEVSTRVRVAAILSAAFWLSAITAGRMIAYTMQPGPGL